MKTKKKVCFIASSPQGILAFHKTNIEKVSQYFDVYIVSNFSDKTQLQGLKVIDSFSIEIERRPTLYQNIKALCELYKIFKEQHFDCFISMSFNASLLSAIAGFFAKIPFRIRIFTGQLWANMSGVKRSLFKIADKLTVKLNTHILVDGIPQLEYLRSNGILNEHQGLVLANGSICGVDVELFSPNALVRKREREKFGITDQYVVFSFLGRLNKDKGIYELISAFSKLVNENSNVKLLLIGNNEGFSENIISQYDNLVLGENVILYGFTKKPYEALQISDVFCLPSYREGFGMSVIEAASLSIPVICSDIYGLKDSFIPNETGLQCKVKDSISLFNCMKRFCEDSELRCRLGINGRKRVVEKFNKNIVSSAWADYLNNKINKNE